MGRACRWLLEPAVDDAAFGGAHGLEQGGAGLVFAQAFCDLIEVGEWAQDPDDEPRRLFGGLMDCPSTSQMSEMSVKFPDNK